MSETSIKWPLHVNVGIDYQVLFDKGGNPVSLKDAVNTANHAHELEQQLERLVEAGNAYSIDESVRNYNNLSDRFTSARALLEKVRKHD